MAYIAGPLSIEVASALHSTTGAGPSFRECRYIFCSELIHFIINVYTTLIVFIQRVGMGNFLEAIGVEPIPQMVAHPRENPYVFYEEYFEEDGEDTGEEEEK